MNPFRTGLKIAGGILVASVLAPFDGGTTLASMGKPAVAFAVGYAGTAALIQDKRVDAAIQKVEEAAQKMTDIAETKLRTKSPSMEDVGATA